MLILGLLERGAMKLREAQKVLKEAGAAGIPRLVRSQREILGLNQLELSKLSGVPQSNIHRIEDGKQTITARTFARLMTGIEKASKRVQLHSQSNAERLHEFRLRYLFVSGPPLSEDARSIFELADQIAKEGSTWKHQLDVFQKWFSENVTAKKVEELEAFKENVLGLSDEHLPAIASAKLQSTEAESLSLAKARYEKEMRQHGLDVRPVEPEEEK